MEKRDLLTYFDAEVPYFLMPLKMLNKLKFKQFSIDICDL